MGKALVHYSLLLVGMAVAASILLFTKDTNDLNQCFFKGNSTLNLHHDNQKMTLMRNIFMYLSLFVFVPTLMIMILRIVGAKSSPATSQDPLPIKVLNRIISNTIEQSFVFLGLYAYFLFDKTGNQLQNRFQNRQIILIASWFLTGRLLFGITYFIGGISGYPTLRSAGFAINVTVQLLLIELCFSPVPLTSPLFLGK